ncbi:flagellar motor switch protein FliN [Rickettsia endosymbiont of Cardiosporidium cionae]|uniref:flagellar motor switch protein FliN n=1 Tax=Rickettsia endosymbiont of Cardiosporidium cionae TaxID=2777155 RepID=UPI0018950622|nr:flagellar motor switch protein FliN [Rickettsia endosymbiont of Cardiosporidium cionae]KAF8818694.1 hypothetical protein IHI24_000419 [Rickettsia endosymbiont of Cardiosporidium cionae]
MEKKIIETIDSVQNEVNESQDEKDERKELNMESLYDIPITLSAVLGSTKMSLNKILQLTKGSSIVLDRNVGESVDIYVNNKAIGKGEVVIRGDKIAITVNALFKKDLEQQ